MTILGTPYNAGDLLGVLIYTFAAFSALFTGEYIIGLLWLVIIFQDHVLLAERQNAKEWKDIALRFQDACEKYRAERGERNE